MTINLFKLIIVIRRSIKNIIIYIWVVSSTSYFKDALLGDKESDYNPPITILLISFGYNTASYRQTDGHLVN